MKFHCCDERRLEVLRAKSKINAIEFVEVLDVGAPASVPRQRTLFVRLLRATAGANLAPTNFRIDGGERIPTVGVEWVSTVDDLSTVGEAELISDVETLVGGSDDDLARTLIVRTDSSGDHSRYRLSIVSAPGSDQPPEGFDIRLSSIEFSFKVECPTDFDCAEVQTCPPVVSVRPNIDYLAKDYAGFRRLMLDRLSMLVPGWTERSAADLGVTLVELLAFAAETLSYRQDAIANEAYLATARQRISVRRHARLVDYFLHEGCNARAFVHVKVGGAFSLAAGTKFLSNVPNLPAQIAPASREFDQAIASGALVFESTSDVQFDPKLNEKLAFYTWGDLGCCLPTGTTSAWLDGDFSDVLEKGDFLIFEEILDPVPDEVGGKLSEKDADRSHRHVVRLTRVEKVNDPAKPLFVNDDQDDSLVVTEIEWDADDALPFPLCIGVTTHPGEKVSVAWGNIVLLDHGRTIDTEELGGVPKSETRYAHAARVIDRCKSPLEQDPDLDSIPVRFRPALSNRPLTHGFALSELLGTGADNRDERWSATSLRRLDARDATPLVKQLTSDDGEWEPPKRDLLSSGPDALDYVVEIEDSGRARLRFGDGTHGTRPRSGSEFNISYRIGNGRAGNAGAEAIAHIVTSDTVTAVRNPLPAFGGTDPEDVEAARRDAPQAFRTQERAVTPADYAVAAQRRPEVQRAAATFRWTGSWHTVFVTADRFAGAAVDQPFETQLRSHLERFRMAGYDLEVDAPHYVPLNIGLHLCVKPGYFQSEVVRAAREVLSNRVLVDGRLGAFHPDNFSFGQPVYLSPIVAAAQAVEGAESVRVVTFQRLIGPNPTSLDDAVIRIGRLEIAELENNPNFRERGVIRISAGGGR